MKIGFISRPLVCNVTFKFRGITLAIDLREGSEESIAGKILNRSGTLNCSRAILWIPKNRKSTIICDKLC